MWSEKTRLPVRGRNGCSVYHPRLCVPKIVVLVEEDKTQADALNASSQMGKVSPAEVPVRIPRGVTLVGGEQLHPHRHAEDHENPDGGASSTRKRHQTGRDW